LSIGGTLDAMHRRLARSELAVALACKVRNQCNRVIQCHLGPSIWADQNGERLLIEKVAPHLSMVFDVGANTGEWSRLVRRSNQSATIHMFECNSQLADGLRSEFISDGAAVIHDHALGDVEGRQVFYCVDSSPDLGSLVHPDAGLAFAPVTVQVRTIDAICSELGIDRVDLLKVDTEGYDFRVLRGASRMISEQRVMTIQFEYGAGWARCGSTLLQCIEWLSERNYKTFLLTPEGHKPFDYARWGEFLGYSNFVALSPQAVLR
jgi:FkbM family methyltransferase